MTQPIQHIALNLPITTVSRTDSSAPYLMVGAQQDTGFSIFLSEKYPLSKMLDKLRERLTEDEYSVVESWLTNGESLPVWEELAGKIVPFLVGNNQILDPQIGERVQQQLALQMSEVKQLPQSEKFSQELKDFFRQLLLQPDKINPAATEKESTAATLTQIDAAKPSPSLVPTILGANLQTDEPAETNMLLSISSAGTEVVRSTPVVATGASATASQHSAGILNVPLGEPGWNQALGKQIRWMIGSAVQSASLKITPPQLGPIEINLAVINEQAEVRFAAQHDQVREALEAAIPRLREMFRDISLDLVNVDVGKKEVGSHPQFSTLVSDQGTKGEQRSEGYVDTQDSTEVTGNQAPDGMVSVSGSGLVDDYA